MSIILNAAGQPAREAVPIHKFADPHGNYVMVKFDGVNFYATYTDRDFLGRVLNDLQNQLVEAQEAARNLREILGAIYQEAAKDGSLPEMGELPPRPEGVDEYDPNLYGDGGTVVGQPLPEGPEVTQ